MKLKISFFFKFLTRIPQTTGQFYSYSPGFRGSAAATCSPITVLLHLHTGDTLSLLSFMLDISNFSSLLFFNSTFSFSSGFFPSSSHLLTLWFPTGCSNLEMFCFLLTIMNVWKMCERNSTPSMIAKICVEFTVQYRQYFLRNNSS